MWFQGFVEADLNGDGVIDLDEFTTAFQQMLADAKDVAPTEWADKAFQLPNTEYEENTSPDPPEDRREAELNAIIDAAPATIPSVD